MRIGDRAFYQLTAEDAEQINRRRISVQEIAERLKTGTWPRGAQAHVGSVVVEGDIVALTITRIRDGETPAEPKKISGQALLDGTDTFWIQEKALGVGLGCCFFDAMQALGLG